MKQQAPQPQHATHEAAMHHVQQQPASNSGFSIVFRGTTHPLPLDPATTTCADLLAALQAAAPQPLAPHTLKVLLPKRAGGLQLDQQPQLLLAGAGVLPGARVMLVGSLASELAAVEAAQAAQAALRLPSFEHEAARAAARRRGGASSSTGRHYFGDFRVLLPPPGGLPRGAPDGAAALALLHRLAADPGIAAVMAARSWRVGLLSEMPPEGKVGVSAMCILGYNVNKGQEISLRLRTDDLAGFRKYRRIRETLVHELAHMVHSEHDANFKALNSQLLREVAAHEAAAAAGARTLAGDGVFDGDWLGRDGDSGGGAGRSAAAAPAGRTLGGAGPLQHVLGARTTAAAAAMARWRQQQQQQQQQQVQAQAAAIGAVASTSGVPAAKAAGSQGTSAAGAADNDATAAAAVPAASHHDDVIDLTDGFDDDPATAAAEQAMTRLGSMQETDVQQQQQQQDLEMQEQQQQELSSPAPPSAQQQEQRQQGHAPGLPHASAAAGIAEIDLTASDDEAAATAPPQQQQQQQQQDVAVRQPQQHELAQDAAGDEAAADAAPLAAAGVDDVALHKLRQAQALVTQLGAQAGGGAQQLAVLEAVAGVLRNLATEPGQQRFRRLRCGNAAFQARLGRLPAAVGLLQLAGFEERQLVWQQPGQQPPPPGQQQELEPVLVYVRDDPGLLWLVLSVVADAAVR